MNGKDLKGATESAEVDGSLRLCNFLAICMKADDRPRWVYGSTALRMIRRGFSMARRNQKKAEFCVHRRAVSEKTFHSLARPRISSFAVYIQGLKRTCSQHSNSMGDSLNIKQDQPL